MKKRFSHLTLEDRRQIECWRLANLPPRVFDLLYTAAGLDLADLVFGGIPGRVARGSLLTAASLCQGRSIFMSFRK